MFLDPCWRYHLIKKMDTDCVPTNPSDHVRENGGVTSKSSQDKDRDVCLPAVAINATQGRSAAKMQLRWFAMSGSPSSTST